MLHYDGIALVACCFNHWAECAYMHECCCRMLYLAPVQIQRAQVGVLYWVLSPPSVQEHTVDIPPVSNGPSRGVPPTQLILPPSQHQGMRKSQGSVLYCRQLWALFVKRAISAKRDRLAVVMQLLVPILLVLLALRAGKASSSLVQEPSLLISRCAVLCCAALPCAVLRCALSNARL